MKKLTTILLLIPIFVFSQTEREQKTAIRNNSSVPQTQSFSNPKLSSESFQKTSIRETPTRNYNFGTTRNYNYGDPFSFNRWYRWGAPTFGYNFYDNWSYFDNWGFRQPARIYVYNDGRRDTIRGKKTHIRTGVSYTTSNQIGGWLTIGNKNYFIAEYVTKNPQDISTFYSDVTMDMVIGWNDRRTSDIIKNNIFYFGVGRKTDIFNYHVMLGIGNEKVNYQFYDDLLILSNNGFYSFKNYSKQFTTLKVGLIRDFKFVSVKGDYDIFRRNVSFGLGILF
jgi:hypothetical protein